MIEIRLDALPPLLREIAELIGIEPALALTRHAVGRGVYIPERLPPDHWLPQLIGPERAKLMAHRFGKNTLTIPKAPRIVKVLEAASLYAADVTIPRIAARLKITSRYVRRLLREAGTEPRPRSLRYEPMPERCPVCGRAHRPRTRARDVDPAQLDLF